MADITTAKAMLRRYPLTLLAVTLICTSCASQPRIDAAHCKAQGGSVQGVGLFATPACVIPFSDGGMKCQDSQECKGVCKASPDAKVGAKASGTCQADTHDIYGCYNELKAGMVVAGMCFD